MPLFVSKIGQEYLSLKYPQSLWCNENIYLEGEGAPAPQTCCVHACHGFHVEILALNAHPAWLALKSERAILIERVYTNYI